MNQALIGELGEFPGATVFAVQGVVYSGAYVEFWLKILDVRESYVYAVGLETGLCVHIVRTEGGAPEVIDICAPFHD